LDMSRPKIKWPGRATPAWWTKRSGPGIHLSKLNII